MIITTSLIATSPLTPLPKATSTKMSTLDILGQIAPLTESFVILSTFVGLQPYLDESHQCVFSMYLAYQMTIHHDHKDVPFLDHFGLLEVFLPFVPILLVWLLVRLCLNSKGKHTLIDIDF